MVMKTIYGKSRLSWQREDQGIKFVGLESMTRALHGHLIGSPRKIVLTPSYANGRNKKYARGNETKKSHHHPLEKDRNSVSPVLDFVQQNHYPPPPTNLTKIYVVKKTKVPSISSTRHKNLIITLVLVLVWV